MARKYLSELMEDKELKQNTLIISPVGSGKTNYAFNHLLRGKKGLYLCDNSNLLEQVLLEGNEQTKVHKINEIPRGFKFDNTDITVMTYKRFGIELSSKNISYDDFDIVVADEIHNLIDYETFNGDKHLFHVSRTIFEPHKAQLVYFTATPYYLQELEKVHPDISKNVKYIDFSSNEDIVRYINIRESYITHQSQVQFVLDEYKEGFKYGAIKGMLYTKKIEDMKYLERVCKERNLNPICLWSTNNEDYPLSLEQERVRKHLLETGELLEPYNVLIINRAFETGVNIYDKKIRLVIILTTNVTEQIQARGRIRNDIDLLTLKTNDESKREIKITLENKWIGVPLTKKDKDKLVQELNIKNNYGKFIKWTAIKKILLESDYEIKEKSKRVEEKIIKVTLITKKATDKKKKTNN